MDKLDELTAEELKYLETGGKAELPGVVDSIEAGDGDGGEALEPAKPPVTPDAAAPDSAEDDESADDDDEELTAVTGRDGKTRFKGKDGKFVSHRALHAEREKRKNAQKEAETLRIQLARGEERLAILNEAFNAGAAGDPQKPTAAAPDDPLAEEPVDPTKDPFGAIEQLRRQNAALIHHFQGHSTQVQQADTMNRVKEVYHNDARRLMAEDPNFESGYRFLVSQRHKELEVMGVANEADRNRIISQEETGLVVEALKAKISPAQAIYNIAKARGFAPPQPPAEAPNDNQPSRSGAPDPAKVSAAAEKIASVKKGQQAADTLSMAGSSSGDGLTFAQLASMNDEEFAAAVDSMSKTQIERMLGR